MSLITGLWHCQGCGEKGNAYQAALRLGRPEPQARELARRFGLFIEREREKSKLPGERQYRKWREQMRDSPSVLRRLQEVKGWEPRAVARLGLGWDGDRIVFVVRDKNLRPVGVVRYLPGGDPKSLALPGSKRGLFPAPELISRQHPLFVVEGEGDAVAVWSLGLKAVGVPGAGSWRPEWAERLCGRRVIVLCDCDPQGRGLAERVARDVPKARIVDLDPARSDGFDVGEMVREAYHEGGIWQVRVMLEGIARD